MLPMANLYPVNRQPLTTSETLATNPNITSSGCDWRVIRGPGRLLANSLALRMPFKGLKTPLLGFLRKLEVTFCAFQGLRRLSDKWGCFPDYQNIFWVFAVMLGHIYTIQLLMG